MRTAQRIISHISSLTVTEGEQAGNKFRVLPWQKKFINGIFAEGVEVAALSVALGNGRSQRSVAVVSYEHGITTCPEYI